MSFLEKAPVQFWKWDWKRKSSSPSPKEDGYREVSTYDFESDNGRTGASPPRNQSYRGLRIAISSAAAAICLIVTTFLITKTLYSHGPAQASVSSSSLPRTQPCGTTLAEAKAANCIYDPLAVYWMPPSCSPTYALEFLQYSGTENKQWPYFPDQNGTEALDLSTYPLYERYWTTWGEHLTHCAFMLVRLADAVHTGKKLDKMTRHFEHSEHCAMMLLEASQGSPMWDSINTWGEVRSGNCW